MSALKVDDALQAIATLQQEKAALIDLLQRIHERLTDGREIPDWLSGWAEEIEDAIAHAERAK